MIFIQHPNQKDLARGDFIVGSHARIETGGQMLVLIGIPLLGFLRRQLINSAIIAGISWGMLHTTWTRGHWPDANVRQVAIESDLFDVMKSEEDNNFLFNFINLFLVQWHINLGGLFNVKAILAEEKWYYLTGNLVIRRFILFLNVFVEKSVEQHDWYLNLLTLKSQSSTLAMTSQSFLRP